MSLSPAQVRTLAPDAGTAKAAEGLADARRWSDLGRSEHGAWGLCQGSASAPYQAAIDLTGPAYSCSCPSRKIPCKHALGLLFLLAQGSVPDGPPAPWAETWFAGRASRAAAAAARAASSQPTVDQEARARRREARERKVQGGLDELDRWLGDLIRRGLDRARGEGYAFWDAMGARLVDAQAPGLARSVRGLGWAANSGDAWPHRLLEGTARLHLLVGAYRRIDALPTPLAADVRSLVGWTTREEDLDDEQAVDDRWLVLGRTVAETGQVMTARTTLLGERTGRWALHLAFGVNAAPPTVLALPGQAFTAKLAFFPSATPLRAAVRPVLVPDGEVTAIRGALGIAEMLDAHARRMARNPFLATWPVALREVVPVLRGERPFVRDKGGTELQVEPEGIGPMLLALSGGGPVTLAGTWDGRVLWPFGVLDGERYELLDEEALSAEGLWSEEDDEPVAARDPGWRTLVSAALLGTERVGPGTQLPDGTAPLAHGSPEARLLAAAAVTAVRARAGHSPAHDVAPLPDPAPLDSRPVIDRGLAGLVGATLRERRSIVSEAMGLLEVSGHRPPYALLPRLLEAAQDDPSLQRSVVATTGPRGAWLAARSRDLVIAMFAVTGDIRRDALTAAVGQGAVAEVVAALRERDRPAAASLLATRFKRLSGDDRAAVLDGLGQALGPDDEPLLRVALADRRVDVRRQAARLLARLPDSDFARTLVDRVRPLLAIREVPVPGIDVILPAPSVLDGLGFGIPTPFGYGERAWVLQQLLQHLPPARWTEWLGEDAGSLLERARGSHDAGTLLYGWLDAAVHFGDVEWLVAILSSDGRPEMATGFILLHEAAATEVVARIGESLDRRVLSGLLRQVPAPWPAPLVELVMRDLMAGAGEPDGPWGELLGIAAGGLPPDRAEVVASLVPDDGRPRPTLAAAIDLIRFRARLHEAFAALPPPPDEVPR